MHSNQNEKKPSFRLGLSLRTLTVVTVTLAATMGLLMLFSQTIVKKGFETVENRDAMININRLRDAFAMQMENVEVKIIDWSMWDDAYVYMQDGNAAFEKSSLAISSLMGMKFELFVWRLPDGKLRWGRVFDLENEKDLPLDPKIEEFFSANGPLFAFKNEEDIKTGIVDIPTLGPTFISVQPVLTSESKGPIVGSLIAGRAINKTMIERLMKLTHLDLVLKTPEEAKTDPSFSSVISKLQTLDDMVINPVDEATIAGFTMFQDLFDKPIAYVEMRTPREIHAQGKTTINSFFVALSLAGLVFGIVVLFTLQRSVVSRVTKLASALGNIRRSSDLRLRVPQSGNDEISDLSLTTNEMLASIEIGQQAISARNHDMKLILDNAEQGFINVALDGTIVGERSAVVDRWLGIPMPKMKVWDYVNKGNAKQANLFRLGWDQLLDGFMPFEVVADQMPNRITIGEDKFQITLRPVTRDQKLESILVVVSNITEAVKAEEKEREQKETMKVVQNIIVDKNAVSEFFEETRKGVEVLVHKRATLSRPTLLRLLHTLKGNAAQQGLETFAHLCHDLESKMLEDADGEISPEKFAEVSLAWQDVEVRFTSLLENSSHARLEVDRNELESTITMVKNKAPHENISQALMSWQLEPVGIRLHRLGRIAEGLGKRLGKGDLNIQINDHGIKLDKDGLGEFWGIMVHVIRNAIDHGLETPEERMDKDKSPNGSVVLAARAQGDALEIAITDDGKGIDWARVQTKARERNLPAETKKDLANALFADGVSTKDEVTDISGRGVGMAAVKQMTEQLGGEIKVDSEKDKGTTFSFIFPSTAVKFSVPNLTMFKKAS
ncbi:MAG: CHASE4 domain-containing protein [Oligoflexales bacterium]